MQIGIATSVFVNYSIHDAIILIAKAGYRCVDIWGGRPHIYRKDFSPEQLRSLRSEIEDRGMKVSSFMPAFFRYPHNLCSPNPKVVVDSMDYVFESMENAAELDAPVLLVCPPRLLKGQDEQAAWEQFADNLSIICERGREYDIRIVLEPVNKNVFNLINTVADAMRMIAYLEKGNLGVILDSGHLYLSDETIEQALSLVGNRLFQVHVNDNDGKRQLNQIPGDGSFDFSMFFRLLHSIGYQGVVSAELSGEYAMDPIPAVEETARRLSKWIGGN
jgi:protein FrlC